MILYRGAGMLVVFALTVFIPLCYGINFIFGKEYYQAHAWPKGFCCLVVGALVWSIGKHLNREAKEKQGEAVHYFMSIKMEYWGIVYAVFGVLYVLGIKS
jgi:hypothetical protein